MPRRPLRLQVTHEDGAATCLRAPKGRGHHGLTSSQGEAGPVGVLGVKLRDEDDPDRAAAWFGARALPVAWTGRPVMGRVLTPRDACGVPLEYHARDAPGAPIHLRFPLYRGREAAADRPLQPVLGQLGCCRGVLGRDGVSRDGGCGGCGGAPHLSRLDAAQGLPCMTWPLPTAPARAGTIWRPGCRRRRTSATCRVCCRPRASLPISNAGRGDMAFPTRSSCTSATRTATAPGSIVATTGRTHRPACRCFPALPDPSCGTGSP